MYKKLAYSVIFVGVVAAVTAIGCGGGTTNPTPDFSMKGDAGPGDMSRLKMYATATPNDVDTNTIGGAFGMGTAVKMTGLVVLTPPESFAAKSKTECEFEVWAQDPTCTVPPCGIVLVTPPITFATGNGVYCPYASDASDLLKPVWQGDHVDITGEVATYSNSGEAFDMTMPSGTVVEHQITLDSLTQTAMKQPLPAPIAVTDQLSTMTPPESLFEAYSGTGWAKYEGTYIKLTPASGKFTAPAVAGSFGNTVFAPGNALFGDDFKFLYTPDGGAAIPAPSSTWTSLGGVVTASFGGVIYPLQSTDFTP
jgi:hypothetical protein